MKYGIWYTGKYVGYGSLSTIRDWINLHTVSCVVLLSALFHVAPNCIILIIMYVYAVDTFNQSITLNIDNMFYQIINYRLTRILVELFRER